MRIRPWQSSSDTSTRRAQFAPNQTRVTGQRRAFLQRYQPAKSGAQVESEVRRERSFSDNRKNILTRALVQTAQTAITYGITAAQEAYRAETDSLVDDAKSTYAAEAAKVSAEQKYQPLQEVDENGAPIFASDRVEGAYDEALSPFRKEAEALFANRKDGDRALSEFNRFRESLDLSHKSKLFNEAAAQSFKHAQERTTQTAMSANSEYELERILKTASENEIFSPADLYALKMKATERIHTNRFSGTIDQLGADMVNMTDEQFDIVADGLVAQLWNDNDSLIIQDENRNLMIKKIQTLVSNREGQIERYNDQQYLEVMQQYAATQNPAVLRAALANGAGDRFGHENSLKLIKMINSQKDEVPSTDKALWKSMLSERKLAYQSGELSEKEFTEWVIGNQQNIGDVSSAFTAIGQTRNAQQKADIKAVRDQLSLHATGMRADEIDFGNQIAKEQKAERDRLLTDLSTYIADNPNGDVRLWGMQRLIDTPLEPSVIAIEGVGENLADTNWTEIVESHRAKILHLEAEEQRSLEGGYGRLDREQLDLMDKLREEYTLLKRYQRSWDEINKPENQSILMKVVGDE